MSMPNIPDIAPDIDLNREEAITLLLASIALEEMGLAHIINAEAEKLQHVLQDKDACLHDLVAVNSSVEWVIKSVTKLQLLLQDKLDTVARLLEKHEPCSRPRPPRPKPQCWLVGSATAAVQNRQDRFFGASAVLNAEVLKENKAQRFPLTYALFMRCHGASRSAQVVPIWEGLTVECGTPGKCPTPENPHCLMMQGRALMVLNGVDGGERQATVQFCLKVWDYGLRRSLHMATWGENEIFNHDSGIMAVTQGDLHIEPSCRRKGQ